MSTRTRVLRYSFFEHWPYLTLPYLALRRTLGYSYLTGAEPLPVFSIDWVHLLWNGSFLGNFIASVQPSGCISIVVIGASLTLLVNVFRRGHLKSSQRTGSCHSPSILSSCTAASFDLWLAEEPNNADRPSRTISKQAFLSKACLTHQHLLYLTLLYNTFGPQFIPRYHLEPFCKCCCFADKRLQCFERAVHRNFTRMASVKYLVHPPFVSLTRG